MSSRSPGFFDVDERLVELSAKGDDLERVKTLVDFEIFRSVLAAAVPRADRSNGGRPPFDHVFMFKVLILQTMHALSDERTEFLIKDRLSFMRFLGLGLADTVPDANTIWAFRETLKKAGAIDVLSKRFDDTLRQEGCRIILIAGSLRGGSATRCVINLPRSLPAPGRFAPQKSEKTYHILALMALVLGGSHTSQIVLQYRVSCCSMLNQRRRLCDVQIRFDAYRLRHFQHFVGFP